METYECSFGERQVDPTCVQTLFHVAVRRVAQPQRAIPPRVAELQGATLHERREREPGVDERRLHALARFGVVQVADKVRDIDEGQPVPGGVEERREVADNVLNPACDSIQQGLHL